MGASLDLQIPKDKPRLCTGNILQGLGGHTITQLSFQVPAYYEVTCARGPWMPHLAELCRDTSLLDVGLMS
eukprot:3359580-Pleurochrysis_carterae.AAC.2